MSDRIVCLNYIPNPEAFGWADGIVHPGLSPEALWEIATRLAWQSPLKISLPPKEPIPVLWERLKAIWEEEWSFTRYSIREDARCTTPTI